MGVYVGINRYKKIEGLSNQSYKYAEDYAETKLELDNFDSFGGYPPFGVIYDKLDLSHRELNSKVVKEGFNYKELENVEDEVYHHFLEEYTLLIEEKEKALKEIDHTNATKKLEREQLWFIKRDYKIGNIIKRKLNYEEHQWFNSYIEKDELLSLLDNLKKEDYVRENYKNSIVFFEELEDEIKKDGGEYVYYVFVN